MFKFETIFQKYKFIFVSFFNVLVDLLTKARVPRVHKKQVLRITCNQHYTMIHHINIITHSPSIRYSIAGVAWHKTSNPYKINMTKSKSSFNTHDTCTCPKLISMHNPQGNVYLMITLKYNLINIINT